MKDMFGRFIKEDDVVVYSVRSSCTVNVRIAKVLKVTDKNARVKVIGGNDYRWKNGVRKWNVKTHSTEHHQFDGYVTSIRVSEYVMVVNGIDAAGIHDLLINTQKVEIQKYKDPDE